MFERFHRLPGSFIIRAGSMHTPVPALVPRVDWDPVFFTKHPAFAPLAPAASRFASFDAWPAVEAWNTALADLGLTSAGGVPLRFIEQPPRRRRRAPVALTSVYDVRIHDLGEVPSRPGTWHDYLNMLCWATFPRAKAALNARQERAIRAWLPEGATHIPGIRTREQDALAILDEGGALVPCLAAHCHTLDAAIACGDVDAVAAHVRLGHARVLAFGHASYEHLVSSHPTVRAMAVTLAMDALPSTTVALVDAADRALAACLATPGFLSVPREDPAVPMSDAMFVV